MNFFSLILLFVLFLITTIRWSQEYEFLSLKNSSFSFSSNVIKKVLFDEGKLSAAKIQSTFHWIIEHRLGLNSNRKLAVELLPEAEKIVQASRTRLRECYDDTLDRGRLNIFREPLGSIAQRFFVSFPFLLNPEKNLISLLKQSNHHLIESGDLHELIHRIRVLLANVRELASEIISCAVDRTQNRTEEVTRLGLTSMSAYVSMEFGRFGFCS